MYLGKLVELADSYELIFNSIHPYTRSLISAIPIADPKQSRASKRIILEGDVPSPLNPQADADSGPTANMQQSFVHSRNRNSGKYHPATLLPVTI